MTLETHSLATRLEVTGEKYASRLAVYRKKGRTPSSLKKFKEIRYNYNTCGIIAVNK
jgi:hypothetical protein